MNYIYGHIEKGDYGRNSYICSEADEDVLIFGSSRAIHHYNPEVFEKRLEMSCYNCGEDGMGIILSYGRYKLLQRRHQPKLIIYDVEMSFDLLKNDNTKYLGFLRPYYEEKSIEAIFRKIDSTERIKMLSSLYRYNSRWLDIIAQYKSKSELLAKDYKYAPLKATLNYEPEKYQFAKDEDCDELKLYWMEELIKDCKANDTKLIFVISPVYGEATNHLLRPFMDLCSRYQIPLLDYFADKRFAFEQNLFYDKMHLNETGAVLFSNIISVDVESSLN